MAEVFTAECLFNPDDIDPGHWAVGLPADIERRALGHARSNLYRTPRFDRIIGAPEDDIEVVFDPSTNTWADWRGAMVWRFTPFDIALSAAKRYMTEILGAHPSRFNEEITTLASYVAEEYDRHYPPKKLETVGPRLGPGW